MLPDKSCNRESIVQLLNQKKSYIYSDNIVIIYVIKL